MSDWDGFDGHGDCPDCGGMDGNHFSDCPYDGTGGGRRSSGGKGPSFFKYIVFFILGLIGVSFLVSLTEEVLASPVIAIIVIELLVVGVVVIGLLLG